MNRCLDCKNLIVEPIDKLRLGLQWEYGCKAKIKYKKVSFNGVYGKVIEIEYMNIYDVRGGHEHCPLFRHKNLVKRFFRVGQ